MILEHKTTGILARATRRDNRGRRSFLIEMTARLNKKDVMIYTDGKDIGWVEDHQGGMDWQEYKEPEPQQDPPPEPPRMEWREKSGKYPAGMYREDFRP